MRILYPSSALVLTDHLPLGEGLIAWQLLEALARRGHDVTAITHTADFRVVPSFRAIESRPAYFESLESLSRPIRLRRVARSLGHFDVVHWLFPQDPSPLGRCGPHVIGPLVQPWPALWGRRPLRAGDIVATVLRPVDEMLRWRALTRAEAILVATPDVSDRLPARVQEKVHWVPFGVDSDVFATLPLPEEPSVLFLGRLHEMKGVRQLLRSFPAIRSRVPRATLTFAGDGPEADWLLAESRRLGIETVVHVVGPVPHAEVARYLGQFSLLACPSDGEPFGMVLLEAMSAGRAVVAGDSGGPRTIVRDPDGGRLVSVDEVAIANAITELLCDEDRLKDAGRFNRERVLSLFSLEYVVERLEEIYADIAARHA